MTHCVTIDSPQDLLHFRTMSGSVFDPNTAKPNGFLYGDFYETLLGFGRGSKPPLHSTLQRFFETLLSLGKVSELSLHSTFATVLRFGIFDAGKKVSQT